MISYTNRVKILSFLVFIFVLVLVVDNLSHLDLTFLIDHQNNDDNNQKIENQQKRMKQTTTSSSNKQTSLSTTKIVSSPSSNIFRERKQHNLWRNDAAIKKSSDVNFRYYSIAAANKLFLDLPSFFSDDEQNEEKTKQQSQQQQQQQQKKKKTNNYNFRLLPNTAIANKDRNPSEIFYNLSFDECRQECISVGILRCTHFARSVDSLLQNENSNNNNINNNINQNNNTIPNNNIQNENSCYYAIGQRIFSSNQEEKISSSIFSHDKKKKQQQQQSSSSTVNNWYSTSSPSNLYQLEQESQENRKLETCQLHFGFPNLIPEKNSEVWLPDLLTEEEEEEEKLLLENENEEEGKEEEEVFAETATNDDKQQQQKEKKRIIFSHKEHFVQQEGFPQIQKGGNDDVHAESNFHQEERFRFLKEFQEKQQQSDNNHNNNNKIITTTSSLLPTISYSTRTTRRRRKSKLTKSSSSTSKHKLFSSLSKKNNKKDEYSTSSTSSSLIAFGMQVDSNSGFEKSAIGALRSYLKDEPNVILFLDRRYYHVGPVVALFELVERKKNQQEKQKRKQKENNFFLNKNSNFDSCVDPIKLLMYFEHLEAEDIRSAASDVCGQQMNGKNSTLKFLFPEIFSPSFGNRSKEQDTTISYSFPIMFKEAEKKYREHQRLENKMKRMMIFTSENSPHSNNNSDEVSENNNFANHAGFVAGVVEEPLFLDSFQLSGSSIRSKKKSELSNQHQHHHHQKHKNIVGGGGILSSSTEISSSEVTQEIFHYQTLTSDLVGNFSAKLKKVAATYFFQPYRGPSSLFTRRHNSPYRGVSAKDFLVSFLEQQQEKTKTSSSRNRNGKRRTRRCYHQTISGLDYSFDISEPIANSDFLFPSSSSTTKTSSTAKGFTFFRFHNEMSHRFLRNNHNIFGASSGASKSLRALFELGLFFPSVSWYFLMDESTFLFMKSLRYFLILSSLSQQHRTSRSYFGWRDVAQSLEFVSKRSGILFPHSALKTVMPRIPVCLSGCRQPYGELRVSCCMHSADLYEYPLSGFWPLRLERATPFQNFSILFSISELQGEESNLRFQNLLVERANEKKITNLLKNVEEEIVKMKVAKSEMKNNNNNNKNVDQNKNIVEQNSGKNEKKNIHAHVDPAIAGILLAQENLEQQENMNNIFPISRKKNQNNQQPMKGKMIIFDEKKMKFCSRLRTIWTRKKDFDVRERSSSSSSIAMDELLVTNDIFFGVSFLNSSLC